MRLGRTSFVALCLGIAATLLVPLGDPGALAQDRATEREQLEKRKADLDREIAALEKANIDLRPTIEARTADVQRATAQLEVIGDEFTRTVEARKVPSRARLLIAIDAYERGDRTVTNLLAELLLESTDAERLSELETQRELYNAVVAHADQRIASIDDQLRALAGRVTAQQAAIKGVQDQLNALIAKRNENDASFEQKTRERADVQRRLDAIIASATTGLLTGLPSFEDRNRPAIVVKIDNVESARPPVGINKADVVFEELVEGGLTRLAAVFHSRGSDPVGPVRSARSTDVRLFPMLNRPLFANSGGNGGVRFEMSQSTLVDVGNSVVPGAYYRDENRVVPHNLFTSTSELWGARGGDGGAPPALFSFRGPNTALPPTAQPIGGVTIRFPTRIDYDWNGAGWTRTQSGRQHVDSDGTPIVPTNVIVQFVPYKQSSADPNSPEAVVVGTGDAWFFTAGHMILGNWSRADEHSVSVFTDSEGRPITLTPGTTWVELPRPGTAEPR
jgi:prefoldin subunit 5